ncbi:MAG TPA: hypothetical protein VGJ22_09470 [Anaerolineales bacterium]|jgi:hypothetical protein
MRLIKRGFPYLLALVALLASGSHLQHTILFFDPANDMVSGWEEHTKLIRGALPADVYEAGYLEEADLPDSPALHDPAEFFLTQYGIAPVVLVEGFGPEWIIGNFGGASIVSIEPWLKEQIGEYTIQNLGFGIYVIHDIEN